MFKPTSRLQCDFYTNIVSLEIKHIDSNIISDFYFSYDDTKLRELILSELKEMGITLCVEEILSIDTFCGFQR